ncbi:MAG: hypothetical protein J2P37_15065 [Ktedonobacteraceae bacterium]|nr:hypothetical protein [Ktedonobacteraceae bacterium]MBO0790159.1 hypothetical protein [Ktedonobacteraceae bacterium]
MPDPAHLAKAELHEIDSDFKDDKPGGKKVKVQFNPETLKVSFANQIQAPSGGGDQKGTPSMQFVGAGTTKLSVQLWFDVNAPEALDDQGNEVDDVRKLTQQVAYFITPIELSSGQDKGKFVPPAVRFLWGSFQFDGIMDSLEESLEFFSSEGRPLRASVTFGLSQQKIQKFVFGKAEQPPAGGGGLGGAPAGTTPLTPAPFGATIQGLAAGIGLAANWQAIATANDIENPRLLQPGQLINLDVKIF